MPADPESPSLTQIPSTELAVLYCRGRDVHCPTCGYSLRDITTPLCPECGRASTLEQLASSRAEPAGRLGALLVWTAGPVGWLLSLAVLLVGAGIASGFIQPVVRSGKIPWLVGAAAIILAEAAWIGLLLGAAKWLSMPIRTTALFAPASPSRTARLAAMFTAPRSLRRMVLMLVLSSLIAGIWNAWARIASLVYYFGNVPRGDWLSVWSVVTIAGSAVNLTTITFSLAAYIIRSRRRRDPLADGVVVGWLIVGLGASYVLWTVESVIAIIARWFL